MFAFKFEVHTKSVLVKTKLFNRQTVISIKHLFKVLSTGTNTCPQPWPPLINGLVDDALLELSPEKLTAASDRRRLVWVTVKRIPASNPDPIVDQVEVWRVCRPGFRSNEVEGLTVQKFDRVTCPVCYFKFLQGSVATLFR